MAAGAIAPIVIAKLPGGLAMTAAEFFIACPVRARLAFVAIDKPSMSPSEIFASVTCFRRAYTRLTYGENAVAEKPRETPFAALISTRRPHRADTALNQT